MTTILTFIIPALIVVLLSLPLVNVFKGKVTAKSAKCVLVLISVVSLVLSH